MEINTNEETLTLQQQRFCDEYLLSFNAFRAAMLAGYSENTARKGELLHVPKIQEYLKAAMRKTQQRLEITHDMILRELAKIAFANMGNFYDEQGVLKPMYELTDDEKASISQYQILDAVDDDGYRVGRMAKIKLHNKLSALDKIARHLNFYGVAEGKGRKTEDGGRKYEVLSQEPEVLSREAENGRREAEDGGVKPDGGSLKAELRIGELDAEGFEPEILSDGAVAPVKDCEGLGDGPEIYIDERGDIAARFVVGKDINETGPPLLGGPADALKNILTLVNFE